MKGCGPRPRTDEDADFLARLRATFRWVNDPDSDRLGADVTGWWRDPAVLAGLGPALGRLVRDARLVVLAPQLRGTLLAPGIRVVFIDDWADTGGQLQAAHAIAIQARAQWVGAAVITDAVERPPLRHELDLRALLHVPPRPVVPVSS